MSCQTRPSARYPLPAKIKFPTRTKVSFPASPTLHTTTETEKPSQPVSLCIRGVVNFLIRRWLEGKRRREQGPARYTLIPPIPYRSLRAKRSNLPLSKIPHDDRTLCGFPFATPGL